MTPNLSNPVRSAVMVRAWNSLRSHVPHPVFAPDGTTMVAVTNSVQYKDATTKAGDAVFTVQLSARRASGVRVEVASSDMRI